jgi:hypothetical protein
MVETRPMQVAVMERGSMVHLLLSCQGDLLIQSLVLWGSIVASMMEV